MSMPTSTFVLSNQHDIFADFDFTRLNAPGFKIVDVREELIAPLLHQLGYSGLDKANRIIRSLELVHPAVRKKSILHYLMEVDGKPAWILETKSPKRPITSPEKRGKLRLCANHLDVQVDLYALCNGHEFALFNTTQDDAVLCFHLADLDHHWEKLIGLLAPDLFRDGAIPADDGMDVIRLIEETVDMAIVANDGATIDEINDALIVRGLEMGFLDVLSQEYEDVSPFVEANYRYDAVTERFHVVK